MRYIKASDTPAITARVCPGTPCFNSLRMYKTCFCESLCDGWFSPFRFTSPVCHCLTVFSERDSHSRFPALLSVLLPLIWFTVNLLAYPSTKAIATSLWTANFLRTFWNCGAMYMYPLLLFHCANTVLGQLFLCGLPFLEELIYLPLVRIAPILETSSVSSYPATGLHSSIYVLMSPFRMSLRQYNTGAF